VHLDILSVAVICTSGVPLVGPTSPKCSRMCHLYVCLHMTAGQTAQQQDALRSLVAALQCLAWPQIAAGSCLIAVRIQSRM
jgi:hypothetical protein